MRLQRMVPAAGPALLVMGVTLLTGILLIAAPRNIHAQNSNLCLEDWCFKCPATENSDCHYTAYITITDTADNITSGIRLRNLWSTKPVVFKNYEEDYFEVILPGSPPITKRTETNKHRDQGHTCYRSWCVADINKDGSEDLVLGSSLNFNGNNSEIGLVNVYINENDSLSYKQAEILETIPHSLFGRSVSCIGDINSDGYEDVAVGAPGEEGGKGAIYIFLGSKAGLNSTYSHRIAAADVEKNRKDLNLKGFGMSISGGVDVDGNSYNDVAVGASGSGHVVLLMLQPVVHLQARLTTVYYEFDPFLKRLPVSFSINATAIDDYHRNSVEVLVWMESNMPMCVYGFRGNCEEPGNEIYRKNLKLLVNGRVDMNVRLTMKLGVNIPPEPIELTLFYKMVGSSEAGLRQPAVELTDSSTDTIKVNHHFSCEHHSCHPDLRLHAMFIDIPCGSLHSVTQVLLRGQKTVKIYVTVESLKDAAFLTTIILETSFFFPVVSMSGCTNRSTSSRMHLACEVAYSLTNVDGARSTFFELQVNDVPTTPEEIHVNISVKSLGEDENQADNFQMLSLLVHSRSSTTGDTTTPSITQDDTAIYEPESEHSFVPNSMPSGVPAWIPVVSVMGGFLAGALTVAAAVAIYKSRLTCRRKNEENYTMSDNLEHVYEVPDAVEQPSYSKENSLYDFQGNFQGHKSIRKL